MNYTRKTYEYWASTGKYISHGSILLELICNDILELMDRIERLESNEPAASVDGAP